MQNERKETLLEVIRQGLLYSGKYDTRLFLGDRKNYLGISDLAKYSECPRAAIAAKIAPEFSDLPELLTLQRGHWFENGIMQLLKKLDLNFLCQLEISFIESNVPMRAHLDFTLVWDIPFPAVRIMEVKSMNKLPEQAYQSHVFQADAQVNILYHFWNKPVFSLKDSAGINLHENLTFPDLCKKHLEISLPNDPAKVSIESWLLCISMQDMSCFGPYCYSQDKLQNILKSGMDMWNDYQTVKNDFSALEKISYAHGYHPMCSYCRSALDCPKYKAVEMASEWNSVIDELFLLKEQKSGIEDKIRTIETELKNIAGNACSGNWLETGQYRFKVCKMAGRRVLDRQKLLAELENIFTKAGLGDLPVESLISNCEKSSAPSSRLQIMAI